jgi:hypothetical protein
MCGMPECNVTPQKYWVTPAVPGARSVLVTHCPACDTRRCPRESCGVNVSSRTAVHCPNGHRL